MNKFHSIFEKYDALVARLENARSANEVMAVYRSIDEFESSITSTLLPMVKNHQDYVELSELLEVYPELSYVSEYLVDPDERKDYDYRAVWQGEEGDECFPGQLDPYDDWRSSEDLDEFVDDAVGVDLLESLRAQVDHQKRSNRPYHHDTLPYADAYFYDRKHDITWQDREDLIFLESVYR